MGNWNDDSTMAYSTYKLYLLHIEATFGGVSHPWNRDYDKAAQLFNNSVLLCGVRTQVRQSLRPPAPWAAGKLAAPELCLGLGWGWAA
jgi:hypothetical protein